MGRESSLHSRLRVLPELPPPTESDQCAACDEEEREEEENKTDPGQTLEEATFRGAGLELGQLGVTERTRAETQQSLHLKQSQRSACSVLTAMVSYLILALRSSVPSQLEVMLRGPAAQGENRDALPSGEGGETETGEGLAG